MAGLDVMQSAWLGGGGSWQAVGVNKSTPNGLHIISRIRIVDFKHPPPVQCSNKDSTLQWFRVGGGGHLDIIIMKINNN